MRCTVRSVSPPNTTCSCCTRRLQEWRADFGSQGYWHAQLGQALVAATEPTLPYMLDELLP